MEINTSVTAAHILCLIDTGYEVPAGQIRNPLYIKAAVHVPKKYSPETRGLALSQKLKERRP